MRPPGQRFMSVLTPNVEVVLLRPPVLSQRCASPIPLLVYCSTTVDTTHEVPLICPSTLFLFGPSCGPRDSFTVTSTVNV